MLTAETYFRLTCTPLVVTPRIFAELLTTRMLLLCEPFWLFKRAQTLIYFCEQTNRHLTKKQTDLNFPQKPSLSPLPCVASVDVISIPTEIKKTFCWPNNNWAVGGYHHYIYRCLQNTFCLQFLAFCMFRIFKFIED